MNLLAHFYLSGSKPEIIVGNFLGDFVKGNPSGRFSKKIVEGIYLHRNIDNFTDSHATVKKSKKRLDKLYGHYKGVMIDIFYDHFLAKNWHLYSDIDLDTFANNMYLVLSKNRDQLNKRSEMVFHYMSEHNWLINYAHLKGIERSLKGLSMRTTFTSNMEYGINALNDQYEDFKNDFFEFFPDIIRTLKQD